MQSEVQQDQSLTSASRRLRVGGAIICEQRRSVEIDGKEQTATDLSWRFLMALVDAAPDVVTYADLSERVWNHDSVTDETIAQRVRQVRRLLGDDPRNPSYIRTIRGRGYQLVLPVEVLEVPKRRRANRSLAVLSILALLIAAGAFWFSRDSSVAVRELPTTAPDITELVARADEYRVRAQFASNELAIELYEEALTLEPAHAHAMLGLSFALSHRRSKYEGSEASALRAAELADRVILHDPENPNAWAARGLADDARGRVSHAIAYYRKGLTLDPPNSNLISSIAYLLQVQGQLHESLILEAQALSHAAPTYFADFQIATALQLAGLHDASKAWLARAETLRPDNIFLLEYQASRLIARGDTEQALVLLEDANSDRFRHVSLRGIALLAAGQADLAVDEFQAAQSLADSKQNACIPCLAAMAARGDEDAAALAQNELAKAASEFREGDEWPQYRVQLAYLATALGDHQSGLRYLQQASQLGYRDWRWLEASPFLGELRDSAGFDELLADMRDATEVEREKIINDSGLRPLLDVVSR